MLDDYLSNPDYRETEHNDKDSTSALTRLAEETLVSHSVLRGERCSVQGGIQRRAGERDADTKVGKGERCMVAFQLPAVNPNFEILPSAKPISNVGELVGQRAPVTFQLPPAISWRAPNELQLPSATPLEPILPPASPLAHPADVDLIQGIAERLVPVPLATITEPEVQVLPATVRGSEIAPAPGEARVPVSALGDLEQWNKLAKLLAAAKSTAKK